MPACAHCSAVNEPDAHYCSHCGAALSADGVIPHQVVPPPAPDDPGAALGPESNIIPMPRLLL